MTSAPRTSSVTVYSFLRKMVCTTGCAGVTVHLDRLSNQALLTKAVRYPSVMMGGRGAWQNFRVTARPIHSNTQNLKRTWRAALFSNQTLLFNVYIYMYIKEQSLIKKNAVYYTTFIQPSKFFSSSACCYRWDQLQLKSFAIQHVHLSSNIKI